MHIHTIYFLLLDIVWSVSTASDTETRPMTDGRNLVAAAIAGIIGTIGFGGLQMMMGSAPVIAGAFPALYTLGPSLAVGWVIHLFHGAVLGIVFAAIVSQTPLRQYLDNVLAMVGLGLVYGVVTTVALAWILLPIWLGAVGFPQAPPFPNVGMSSLIGHLVYGALLGGVYAVLQTRL